ncbi:MAG TPA: acetyl-CoA carboxylase biotin carboxyl carrier protein [Candidatus Omnitrophota bacterium]|nr:acetyl-CoA carboxylase biotin carboxyl carrier protein [Candidatus Omnitrophota bacterium]
MNLKELKEMVGLMKDNDLVELEIEKDGERIRLKKNQDQVIKQHIPQPVISYAPAHEAKVPAASPKEEVNEKAYIVRSPMVGTFYAAPAPDQDPYVTKGKKISQGDVLCIIEAMKLMNEIKSDVSGAILEILVENGTAVEFDQPLFKIEVA